jgi:hypothetical protein
MDGRSHFIGQGNAVSQETAAIDCLLNQAFQACIIASVLFPGQSESRVYALWISPSHLPHFDML